MVVIEQATKAEAVASPEELVKMLVPPGTTSLCRGHCSALPFARPVRSKSQCLPRSSPSEAAVKLHCASSSPERVHWPVHTKTSRHSTCSLSLIHSFCCAVLCCAVQKPNAKPNKNSTYKLFIQDAIMTVGTCLAAVGLLPPCSVEEEMEME